MRVIVTGGTGFVGTHLCRVLADRGHDVTALARHPEDAGAGLPADVDVVAGDVTASDSLEPAFEGQDVAVNLVALSALFKPKGGNEMHFRVHLRGTENVVEAAEEHGVERVVQMSGLGVGPDGQTAYLRAKWEAEEVVRDSEVEHVVFRPSVIFGDGCEIVPFVRLLSPPPIAPLPGGGETPFQLVWIGDLAPMLADGATEEGRAGDTYEIGGPEVLTLADIARQVHRLPVFVVPLPMAVAKLGLAVGERIPRFPLGLDQYQGLQMDHVPEHNDVDAFGVDESELKTLREYLSG